MFESCICAIYDEITVLLSRKQPKARKKYKCIECRCLIQPGDTYERDVTLLDNDFDTYRTCLVCVRIRNKLFKCDWCYGRLWEDIHNVYCGDEEDECICPI